ncbi:MULTISPECIES: ABC transporter permease [unclassified Chelatococcus]|uniref:ABC transporter permease n=1 Tax=unclassified Chelatococcus TaxID=2638111 RepID=UPI001BCABBDC|nr:MULTISPECIES: ABC transporter permease [unclassified Chelatococcus]CAH1659591.1 putative spermidine/putrescine transport system permease protein [Hyphomicrobiales bacterium]MBS7740966.1 ABC transporter permease [Chelatococcus sp. HY11]MBX3546743.1 ABC transporter permease [Chelatococcus sp.]MCO5077786.1 ABC transporter permease [Chelatococcus sp.]CAH1683762.1 putative spermidine/putrescine transport system permease protein [Hyphomicrobiales bacterium]
MDKALDLAAWLVVIFLIGPLVVIMGGSFTLTPYVAFPPVGFTFDWYYKLLHHVDFFHSFILSLVLATLCSLAAMVIGVAAAIGLHKFKFSGSSLYKSFLMSPLLLPTVVTGVALLQFYYMIHIDTSLFGLLAAHVLITVPYVLRTVGAGLVGLDPAIEEAAASLGAGELRTLVRVTLPAIAPSIMAAVIFVFITSFDQTTVSIFLADVNLMPLPVRIFNYIDLAVDPMIAAVSTLLIFFAFGMIVLLQRLLGLDKAMGVG